MKILLVNPPARRFVRDHHPSFPLGPGYLAARLVEAGHDPEIHDAEWGPDFPDPMPRLDRPMVDMALNWYRYFEALENPSHAVWRETEAVIRERKPDLVGVTCRALDLASARVVARLTKSINSDTPVVLGGPATSTCTEQVLADCNVDYAVRGEGEATIVELADALDQSRSDLSSIAGISYRGPSGTVHTADRPLIKDISSLPSPARDRLLYTEQLPERKVRYMMGEMITSRGCPYPCTFCAVRDVWGSAKTRLRTPESVVDEIVHLRDRHGVRFVTLWDDLFTTSRKRTEAICNLLLERQVNVEWLCLVRANTINAELLALMKQAGCVQVQMGVESGSERVLDSMLKGISLDDMKKASELVHQAGIALHIFLIMGLPGETADEMRQTMDVIPVIAPDCVELSVFAPYPGTPLYQELQRAGKITEQDGQTADFLNIDRCYVDGMAQEEFRSLALEYLARCDDYNASRQKCERPSPSSGTATAEPVISLCP